MLVMMDIEISCKGYCEKLSHFLDHVSHIGYLEALVHVSCTVFSILSLLNKIDLKAATKYATL